MKLPVFLGILSASSQGSATTRLNECLSDYKEPTVGKMAFILFDH